MKRVNKHLIYLVVDTSKDPKEITYRINIMIKDTSGEQYLFQGTRVYAYDESGKAYEDLEILQTLNFS